MKVTVTEVAPELMETSLDLKFILPLEPPPGPPPPTSSVMLAWVTFCIVPERLCRVTKATGSVFVVGEGTVAPAAVEAEEPKETPKLEEESK